MAEPQDDWPRCPGCGARRLTRCPVCGTAGTEFAVGDPRFAGRHARLVICPTCDEPFPPEYVRHCEWCGHDFGEGFSSQSVSSKPFNAALVAAAAALLAALASALLYYALF